jgi:hypothetical protein
MAPEEKAFPEECADNLRRLRALVVTHTVVGEEHWESRSSSHRVDPELEA